MGTLSDNDYAQDLEADARIEAKNSQKSESLWFLLLSAPGIEPGSGRPQRPVLTTRLCRRLSSNEP